MNHGSNFSVQVEYDLPCITTTLVKISRIKQRHKLNE